MPLLQLKHIKKYYPVKQNPLKLSLSSSSINKVIDDISFELDEGKVLVLLQGNLVQAKNDFR